MATGHRTAGLVFAVLSAMATLPACEKQQTEKKAESEKDGGKPHTAGVDKNLTEAVAAVAGGKTPEAQAGGPPQSGIFPPGVADHEIRPGVPPKLTLGGKGSGPTIQFAAEAPKKKFEGQLEISVQTGPRSAMPTIDLLVASDAPPAKAADAPPGPVQFGARVTASRLAKEQPGQLPPGLDAQMGKARGSKFSLQVGPDGAGRVVSFEIAKEFDQELGQIVRSAADALALALLPYPAEPVAVGAVWMVASREGFAGLDVIAYRMMTLEKVENGVAIVNVNTKRYVAGGALAFPGLPQKPMLEFSGNTTGKIAVPLASTEAISGQIVDVIIGNFGAETNPQGQQGQLTLHLEIRTQIAFLSR